MKLRIHLRRSAPGLGLAMSLAALLIAALSWSTDGARTVVASSPPAHSAALQPRAATEKPAGPTDPSPNSRQDAVSEVPPRVPRGAVGADPASSTTRTSSRAPDPAETVRRAWQQARDAGRYRFVSDMTQTFYPAPTLAAAGSSPEREELHLEGSADLPAQTLDLRLWQDAGSVLAEGTGVELRVDNGVAYTRRLAGSSGSQMAGAGKWEEAPDISGNFAPGGDALGFLAGTKNVRELQGSGGTEERRGRGAEEQWSSGPTENARTSHVSRFAFEIDGPALARYLRDRIEEQLSEQGKLPAGVTLDTAHEYRDVQGQGEVWIDETGLPLRLTVHLAFPAARDGTHLEADIRSDFSGFPAPAAPPSLLDRPVDWASAALSPARYAGEWAAGGRLLFALALGIGSLALLLAGRRLRRIYVAVVIAVILSMVVVPVLQDQQVAAFAKEQTARQAELDRQQQQQAAARELAAEMAGPAWDPHRDPLATTPGQAGDSAAAAGMVPQTTPTPTPVPADDDCDASDTADRDSDGVNNYEECTRGLGTDSDTDVADTDGDGLLDGVEIFQLGTLVDDWDTDLDSITDTLEVQGYPYGGDTWYLDPLEPDTDADGLLDSVECFTLTVQSKINPATVMQQCDTDHDGTPNPFDLDSDADGVVDAIDLAPFAWTDRGGLHESGFETAKLQPYNRDNPFGLSVEGLEPGWPVLVDLQLRPQETEHLAYALGVLDWPQDTDGQVQHGKNTTWADFQEVNDEPSKHGDMQLVPMLEFEMIGSSLPFSLKTPSATVIVGESTALSTTVTLDPDSNAANTHFTFILPAGSTGLKVYNGTCAKLGSQVGATLTAASHTITGKRVIDLADGNHSINIAGGGSTVCSEIPNVINGPYTDKMVDLSVLKPYNISMSERNTTLNSPVLMYVPLSVVYDDTGGSKTAFQAHMLYWPGAANPWSSPQQVRVVWTVQALGDQCDPAGFPATLEEYQQSDPKYKDAAEDEYDAAYRAHCASHRTPDEVQIVQTYDDNFYVTGVSVREDHGMWVAAAYENPKAAVNFTYPQPENDLWELSLGLGGSFLNQSDCEKPTAAPPVTYDAGNATSYDPATGKCSPDGLRDVTVARFATSGNAIIGNSTIGDRWDAMSPVASTFNSTDRWEIAADALRVKTVSYLDQDSMAEIGTVLVPEILGELETTYGLVTGRSIEPNILFAREEYYRNAGLEAGRWLAGTKVLSLDMGDETIYPERTLTGMNWQAFRYDATLDPVTGEVPGWESVPTDTETDALEDQLGAYFEKKYPGETDANAGRVDTAVSYYTAVNQGVVNNTDPCPAPLGPEDKGGCRVPVAPNSSVDLAKGAVAVGKGVSATTMLVLQELSLLEQRWRATIADAKRGGDALEEITNFQSFEKWSPKGFAEIGKGGGLSSYKILRAKGAFAAAAVGAGLALVGAIVCIVFASANRPDDWAILAYGLQAVGVALAGVGLISSVGSLLKAIKLGTWNTWKPCEALPAAYRTAASSVDKMKVGMAVIGTLISLALSAVSFVIQVAAGGLAKASMAWDSALAGMFASMLTTVVTFFLSVMFGAVGAVIMAAIGLVDMLIGAICTAAGVDPKKDAMVYKWACGGITGALTNVFKMFLYGGALITDLYDEKRLATGDFRFWTTRQDSTLVKGDKVWYSIVVTDAIRLADIPSDNLYALAAPGYWSEDNLLKSSFAYTWTAEEKYELPDDLRLDKIRALWQGPETDDAGDERYVVTQTVNSPFGTLLEEEGEFSPPLYLAEGYAVPEQECWAFAGCSVQEERGKNIFNIGKNVVFDVSPPTLTGFRSAVKKGGGYALDWGGGGLNFPVLYDLDNDGLPRSADGDDSVSDRDGDTLLDSYEIENGTDPILVDTDGDGLWDADEVRQMTNPRLPDSDGDGLLDGEELEGWEFVYSLEGGVARKTWVRSDPSQADADGDTLMDSKEKVYGYNPNVASSLNVLSLTAGLSEGGGVSDGFVVPGQTLSYTADVKNELSDRWAQGLLQAAPDAGLTSSKIEPREFVLRQQESTSMAGTLTVKPDASGLYTVTQVAGALITNPDEPAYGARLWLPFDDASALLSDQSSSVPPHHGSCLKAFSTAGSSECSQDITGKFAGALKLTGTSYVGSGVNVPKNSYAVSLWYKTSTIYSAGQLFTLDTASPSTWSGGMTQVQIEFNGLQICAYVRLGSGYTDEACASLANVSDGKWHHVVHTMGSIDGDSGFHRLYFDGLPVGSLGKVSEMASTPLSAMIGAWPHYHTSQQAFNGLVDDVRVFDHPLTAFDVKELYDQPILSLGFDGTTLLQDGSPLGISVVCGSTGCPGSVGGLAGYGASLSGDRWASTEAKSGLSLNGGHLTLSAWLNPAPQTNTDPQGILGYHSGEADGYPTLQRLGKKVVFGFGAVTATGNVWKSFTSSAEVLTDNTWNHVAVTYDQDTTTVSLYVNGQLRQKDSAAFSGVTGLAAPATPQLDIGRSSDLGMLDLYYIVVTDNGESNDNTAARWCFTLDGQPLLMAYPILASNYSLPGNFPLTKKSFRGQTALRLWEDDGGTQCGSTPDNGDDQTLLKRTTPTQWGQDWTGGDSVMNFTSHEVSNSALRIYLHFVTEYYQDESSFKVRLTNNAIPFQGTLDDVRIYNQTFDAERVQRLYQEGALALRLPLDDPPGTRNFSEASPVRAEVGCTACPIAGLPGRVDQAASFDGSDTLVVPNGAANRIGSTFSVAAWIRPDVLGTNDAIIAATANTKSSNGWEFRVTRDLLGFTLPGTSGGAGGDSVGQPGIAVGKWSHVAAVLGADGKVSFYVDGQLKQAGTAALVAPISDTDDVLLIGARQTYGSSAPSGFFRGVIDDLRVYRTALSAAEVKAIYDEAPVLHLRYDEGAGATGFADGARAGVSGSCTRPACPATGDGVRGQIGLAAQYDGVDDLVTVAADTLLNPSAFTVGAWVKPSGTRTTVQRLVSKGGGSSLNYRLSIDANSRTPRFEACSSYITSSVPLVEGQWNQVLGTYDGSKLRIYVNGSEANPHPVSLAAGCTSSAPAYVGGDAADKTLTLSGALDEVVLYPVALQGWQIHDLFAYQNGWVEDRKSQNIVVDNDLPTADVLLPMRGTYLPGDAQIVITATDATSGIASAALYYGRPVEPAPPCANKATGWCPTFKAYYGEGDYGLQAWATDLVGHTFTPYDTHFVIVDTHPPTVTFGFAAGQRLEAIPDPAQANSWLVHLSGETGDPTAPPNYMYASPGVGVEADGVRVTVYDANGGLAGPRRMVAALNGHAWSLDYPLTDSQPDGCYRVEVESSDALARTPGLDSAAIAQHRTITNRTVGISASAPALQLDQAWLSAHSMISSTAPLGGVATSRPVPVKLTWTSGAGGSKAALSLVCSAPGSPATYAPLSVPAGKFAAGSSYSWGGEIQSGATCQVGITAPAASNAILSGTVSVCADQVAAWSDNGAASQTVNFTSISAACAADSCNGVVAAAGVGRVDVAYTSLLPDSAFVDIEGVSRDEALHLAFEESETPFLDASGGGRNATCSGSACPTTGQEGKYGSALRFDGLSDYVSVATSDAINPSLGEDFTVAGWVKPDATQPTLTSSENCLIEKYSGSYACPYSINYINQKGGVDAGKIKVGRWSYPGPGGFMKSTATVNDGNFHHVAFVGEGLTLRLYIDGNLQGEMADPNTGNTTTSSPLYIGRRGYGKDAFAGLLDDVRVYTRALPQDEIKELCTSYATAPDTGPILQMGFEDPWAIGGATAPDDSGSGHDGLINTGATDAANKSVSGQVGAYALHFDGNDYVSVLPDPGLDLSGGQFTEAAWINSEVTDTTYHGILGYQPAGGQLPQRYPSMWVYQKTSIHAGFGDGTNWNTLTKAGVLQTGWNHVATTYDGTTYKLYVNGAEVYSTAGFSGRKPYAATQQLDIGKASNYYFKGAIDDVRLYPRALPAEEIQGLYRAGWQQTTLTPSGGAAVEAARWSASPPAGLEGSYRVELRSRDSATSPHTAVAPIASSAERTSPTWSTDIDTLAPRVTVCREVAASGGYTYTVRAQDWNLVSTGFLSPCRGVIATPDYFDSPWYVTAAGKTKKLYGLEATCKLASVAADETATARDSAGNIGKATTLSTGAACSFAAAGAAAARASEESTADLAALAAAEKAAAGKPRKPVVAFASTVLTASQLLPPDELTVKGIVSGAGAFSGLVLALGNSTITGTLSDPAPEWPFTRTWTASYPLPDGPLPDGVTEPAVATAMLQGERTAKAEEDLTLDVVPPAAVDLTVTADGSPLRPGATVHAASPELALDWTPSHDGSGLGEYLVRWTTVSAETTTETTRAHAPNGALEDRFTAGEAERLMVDLASQDRYGNQRWQEFGPVVVDGPHTPDYIALGDYDGWMDSGCSLLGTDRRGTRAAAVKIGHEAQQLYASWDRSALRLAWTGANWNAQGDLFVYLDTGPGGTREVFTPFATPVTGTVVSLPADIGADYLVWVRSSERATLLSASGGGWSEVAALPGWEFRFDASRRAGQTDLYLPFELIGLSPGSPLALLAFAAEEPAEGRSLELWATLPLANPVNSPRVSRWVGLVSEGTDFSLLRAYRWPALGDDICPAGRPAGDLELTITANPGGASASGLGSGLFWLPDPDLLASAPESREGSLLAPRNPPLEDGQAVEYTLHYRNLGDRIASGVSVALTPLGQLRLEEQTLVLGDQGVIQPGDWGEAVFHGRADRGLGGPPIAAVKAELYDAEHGPDQGAALDWVWAAHRVDRGAPEGGQIELRSRVGARGVRLTGQAGDESGVREVTIELQGPNGIKTITCPVARPIEGRWSCDWAPEGELPDGSQVTVRLRATDITGQVGEWSAPRTVEIDALPPEVTVNEAASGVLRGGLVGGRSLTLYGTAVDPSGLSVVNACVADLAGSEACGTAQLLADGGWKYGTPDLGALDYVSRTLSISAEDTVGNRSTEPLSLTVRVDNVAPILTAGQVVSDVVLGRARRVLSGTIADGSVAAGGPAVDVSVRVDPPVGEAFRADTARDGSGWHYDLAGARTGLYTLWVDANDAAGNRSSAGPFQVEVTCAEAGVNAVALTAEPSLRGGNGLTLVTVIRNAGPDTIPAGLPFVLYGPADSTVPVTPTGTLTQTVVAIDTMTTTLALAAGETETFTVEWTTGALGQMNFYVAAAGEGTAYAGEAALCSRPEPVRFAAILADVPLYAGWNLISPPVEPLVPAVTAVQRPISGTYSAILGYDGGLQIYDALQPGAATLSTVRAGHGYWVHARSDGTSIPPGENWRATPAAMLHMAGQPVPEEHPLALAAGWNLAGYLPVASLPVTVALQGIEGDYASVLGWAGTAASYYPGLDARYNTLAMLRPSAGYWISVTRAITLEYPPALDWWETVPITATPTITQARALFGRLAMVRGAEQAAGVQPTYNWLNLYGSVYLPDGSPAPISTTVTTLAGGVPCGATLVTDPGHFGLLACYGDDATTPRLIDGARSGDAITFLVNGLPAAARALGFNGQGVPPGQKLRWTAHGERWEVELGAPAVVDVAIAKSVTPGAAAAGAAISYTLAYSNAGSLPAQGVVITDTLPPEIIDPAFTKGGELTEAEGARTVTWHAGDLALGAGGTITVTGRLNPGLTPPLTVTNTAGISAPRDARPENNLTEAILQCIEAPVLKPVVWLPLIVHP